MNEHPARHGIRLFAVACGAIFTLFTVVGCFLKFEAGSVQLS